MWMNIIRNDSFVWSSCLVIVIHLHNGIFACDRLVFLSLLFHCSSSRFYGDILFMVFFSSFLFRSSVLSLNLILLLSLSYVLSPALQFKFHLNVTYCLHLVPSISHCSAVVFWPLYSPTCVQWIKTSISFYFEFLNKTEWLLTAANSNENFHTSRQSEQCKANAQCATYIWATLSTNE